jgi:hypothetical protein
MNLSHTRTADAGTQWWGLELENKPDSDMAMRRIYAWYQQEMIDRPPIRFTAHNSEYDAPRLLAGRSWADAKARWFDAEFQVDFFVESIRRRAFHAETFPVFWPNLGPEVFVAFHGSELIFKEVTSYSIPLVQEWDDMALIRFNRENPYFRKIEEMTRIALERCRGQFLVGYTDLHGGVDCAAAWRDPQRFCLDLIDSPENAKKLISLGMEHFQSVYDHFDAMLKAGGQPSVTWMGVPSFGKMHIPSCDFAAMVSRRHFDEFCLPLLLAEVKPMSHNVFHLDGKGVAKHLDAILAVPEINAVQWVQGMGPDTPILQWLPLIRRIQAAGKSVMVDLQLSELVEFLENVDPKGIMLCIAADEGLQPDVIKTVERLSSHSGQQHGGIA